MGQAVIPLPQSGEGLQGNVSAQVFDSTLTAVCLFPFYQMSATLYYNQVGSWAAVAKYTDELWGKLDPLIQGDGLFLEFNWGGQFQFGGRCEIPGYQMSVPGATNAAVFQNGEVIALSGATWEAIVANRIAFPDPTLAWDAQTLGDSDSQASVPQETAIKHYVSANLGPTAAASRQVPLLQVNTDLGRGSTVSYKAKLAAGVDLNLMDIIRNIVAAGDPMGTRIRLDTVNKQVKFDCYLPNDLSSSVLFSKETGNLTSVNFQIEDPTVTDALVVGKTANVHVTGAGSTNPWTHIEQLVDQSSSTDSTQNTQAGQSAVTQGSASPTLAVTAQDTPKLTYGTDYNLGDKVGVGVAAGDTFSDIISQVDLVVDATQTPPVTVFPTIGAAANNATTMNTSAINRLDRIVRRLERRLNAQIGPQ